MSAYDLIIFDCDGTLVDSEVMNVRAVSALLSGFGFEQFTYDFCHDHYKSLTLTTIVADASRRTGFEFPPDMLARIVEIKRDIIPLHVTAVEGARELVAQAYAVAQICVASNGECESVTRALSHTGLMDFFSSERILTVEEFAEGKPNPAMFLEAARRFGAAAARCLVIEDGLPGVLAAGAAGMAVWGFTGTAVNRQLQKERLSEAGAAPVFDALIHMRDALIPGKSLAPAV